MIYCRTIGKEVIAVHPMNDTNNTQFVELIKYGDEPIFCVCMDDGQDEWYWEFDMSCPSDYERVKLCVFDAIFECDTMHDLAYVLDDLFIDEFEDILIEECDDDEDKEDEEYDECEGCYGCKFYDGNGNCELDE